MPDKQNLKVLSVKYEVSEFSLNTHFFGLRSNGNPHFQQLPTVAAFELIQKYQDEYKNAVELFKDTQNIRVAIETMGEAIAARELKKILESEDDVPIKDLTALIRAINDSKDRRKTVKLKEESLEKGTKFGAALLGVLYGNNDTDKGTNEVKRRRADVIIQETRKRKGG